MEFETKFCDNCKKDVPVDNYLKHSIHCPRNIRLCPKCDEPYPIIDMESHLEDVHAEILCPACHQVVEKADLETHQEKECKKRLVSCLICELKLPSSEIEEHLEYCGSRSDRCDGCGKIVLLKFHPFHLSRKHALTKPENDEQIAESNRAFTNYYKLLSQNTTPSSCSAVTADTNPTGAFTSTQKASTSSLNRISTNVAPHQAATSSTNNIAASTKNSHIACSKNSMSHESNTSFIEKTCSNTASSSQLSRRSNILHEKQRNSNLPENTFPTKSTESRPSKLHNANNFTNLTENRLSSKSKPGAGATSNKKNSFDLICLEESSDSVDLIDLTNDENTASFSSNRRTNWKKDDSKIPPGVHGTSSATGATPKNLSSKAHNLSSSSDEEVSRKPRDALFDENFRQIAMSSRSLFRNPPPLQPDETTAAAVHQQQPSCSSNRVFFSSKKNIANLRAMARARHANRITNAAQNVAATHHHASTPQPTRNSMDSRPGTVGTLVNVGFASSGLRGAAAATVVENPPIVRPFSDDDLEPFHIESREHFRSNPLPSRSEVLVAPKSNTSMPVNKVTRKYLPKEGALNEYLHRLEENGLPDGINSSPSSSCSSRKNTERVERLFHYAPAAPPPPPAMTRRNIVQRRVNRVEEGLRPNELRDVNAALQQEREEINADIEEEASTCLPCEFCDFLIPIDHLILHQSGCRPDLARHF